MVAKLYQVEVFPWFEVAVGNLATIGAILSLVDSAFVHYFEWATWIEFREPFVSLWIDDIVRVSYSVIMFQWIRDWLAALPFGEEKRRDRDHLDELLWRATYAPSTRNWCFLLLIIVTAVKSCLVQHSFQEYALDNVSRVDDDVGKTNGEPLHDYVVSLARALYLEKYAEKVQQLLALDTCKACIVSIVLTATVSSEVALEAAKQLVRTAEQNANAQERRRAPLEVERGNVIVAALVMPVSAMMLKMDTAMTMMALVLGLGNLFRRFYSDKLLSNYTSFACAVNVRLPTLYCFLTLLVDGPIVFAFMWRQEMDHLEMLVLVAFSIYSAANADATKKLNQYRGLLVANAG